MTAQIPSGEPREIVAGDTVQFLKTLADYIPGDGYTLKYRLIGASALDSTSSADTSTYPGSYLITFAAAVTSPLVTEVIAQLIGWVESGSSRYTMYDAPITIRANAATATAVQLLTHEERVLAAIELVIEGKATADIDAYSIGGRSVTKMKPDELLKWRGIYSGRVWRQKNRGKTSPTHAVRFLAPR